MKESTNIDDASDSPDEALSYVSETDIYSEDSTADPDFVPTIDGTYLWKFSF